MSWVECFSKINKRPGTFIPESRVRNCPVQVKQKYYPHYIDDIFLMFEQKDHVKKFFKYVICEPRHTNFVTHAT